MAKTTRRRIRVVVREISIDRKGSWRKPVFDRTVLAVSRAEALRKCESEIREMVAEKCLDPTIKRISVFVGTSYRPGRFTSIGHWWRMDPLALKRERKGN